MLSDFQKYSKDDLERAIDSSIVACLHAERNRRIIKKRLIDGITVKELAKEFNLSIQSIEKILTKNNDIIIRQLGQ